MSGNRAEHKPTQPGLPLLGGFAEGVSPRPQQPGGPGRGRRFKRESGARCPAHSAHLQGPAMSGGPVSGGGRRRSVAGGQAVHSAAQGPPPPARHCVRSSLGKDESHRAQHGRRAAVGSMVTLQWTLNPTTRLCVQSSPPALTMGRQPRWRSLGCGRRKQPPHTRQNPENSSLEEIQAKQRRKLQAKLCL